VPTLPTLYRLALGLADETNGHARESETSRDQVRFAAKHADLFDIARDSRHCRVIDREHPRTNDCCFI